MDGILGVITGSLFLSGREDRMEEVPCSVPWIRTGWPERGVDGILAVVTGNLSLLGRGSRMVERARRWHRSRTRHQRNARAVNPPTMLPTIVPIMATPFVAPVDGIAPVDGAPVSLISA